MHFLGGGRSLFKGYVGRILDYMLSLITVVIATQVMGSI